MKLACLTGALLLLLLCGCCAAANWAPVDQVLEDSVAQGVFPGAVAAVGTREGLLFSKAVGSFTYGDVPPRNTDNPAVTFDTLWDMASCTKVVVTTSAIAQFYQRGQLQLDDKVSKFLGPEYESHGKAPITVLNCLLHDAGYPPDPVPDYWYPAFGCPETSKYHPELSWSCQEKIFNSLLQQTLINPVGAKYVYSDLSMITLMYVTGHLANATGMVTEADLLPGCNQGGKGALECYYEAYVRLHVFDALDMKSSGFLPKPDDYDKCAPAWNDTVYRHLVIQGRVSDGNSFALGGIAGHAGLFSTMPDLLKFMTRYQFAKADEQDKFALNKTTVDLFIKEYNHTQSSRALGWNTNDPTVYDEGWNLTCGNMSATTFMHLGYTGTQLCGDPVREIFTIFLTNRVYPVTSNTRIQQSRQHFNSAVVGVFDNIPAHELSRHVVPWDQVDRLLSPDKANS